MELRYICENCEYAILLEEGDLMCEIKNELVNPEGNCENILM